MPIRGETVGAAYVRILADGRGFPHSLREEMDKAEPVMAAEGQKHGKAYEEEFNTELRKSMPRDLDRTLTESIARSRAIETYFAGPRWKKIATRLERQYGDVGKVIGHNLTEGVRESGDLAFLEERLAHINREVLIAQRQIVQASDEDTAALKRAKQAALDTETNMRRVAEEFRRMRTAETQFAQQAQVDTEFHTRRLVAQFRKMQAAIDAEAKSEPKIFSKNLLGRIEKLGHRLDGLGNKVGKAFGVGARNNAVNAFGLGVQGIVEGLARLFLGLGKSGEKIREFGARLSNAFTSGGGGIKGFGKAAGEAAGGFASVAKFIAIAIPLVTAFIAGLGLLASLLTGVAAAVTALASSLAFAVIGGLAPLVGLIPVVGFGIATLVLGFAGLNKAGKKALAESLKPLNKEFKELRKSAAEGLFGNVVQQAKLLTPVIKELRPLFHDIGGAISDVGTSFALALASPGFKQFVRQMDKFIPHAIRSLGRTARDILGGLGGVFEALIPFTDHFLGGVEHIAHAFDTWANSKPGRQEIRDFLDNAETSARHLGGLLEAIGGLLATVLAPGRAPGDDIISSLTDTVNGWNDALKKNPKALQDFFAHGVDVAKQIGDIITAVGHLIDTLDTPSNRELLDNFFTVFKLALKALPPLIDALMTPMTILIDFFKLLEGLGIQISNAVRGPLSSLVGFVLGIFDTLLEGAARAFGWLHLPFSNALKKASRDFHAWAQGVVADISGIPKGFVVEGELKFQIDAINGAKLTNQAKAKLIEIALNRLEFGGPARKGQPYLVGENGPELFVPEGNGRVVPNSDPAVKAMLRNQKAGLVTNNVNRGRTVDVGGLTIITPSEDPRAVARETVNQLAATALL